ncbi:hypothetical protein ACOMHN_020362 [Nucella lapillus]
MSGSAEAAGSFAGSKSAGVSIGGTADGKSSGVSIGAGGDKSAGVSLGSGVSLGMGGGRSAGATTGGSSLGPSVSAAIGAGKSAGNSSARTGGGIFSGAGLPKSAGMSSTDGKTSGTPVDKTASVGVALQESVMSPLIGAGANVYIMTNELTQSMREKLGTSWPFVQDTLNSRYAKLLAGGLLASVAVIVVWKIIKRVSAKVTRPSSDSEDDDAYQWNTTKTYELTPVSEGNRQGPRSEGDGYILPAKIQLRVADPPLQTIKAAQPEICKARDPATRHRHTLHLEQRQGEQTGDESQSPWHIEQPHDDDSHCSCPSDLCGSQPRLLYSLRHSRMERRAVNLPHPDLDDLLTYASSPSSLYPSVVGPVCPHTVGPKSCCLAPHTVSAYSPYGVGMVPGRMSEGAPLLASHHHPLFHSPQTDSVNLMTTACPLPPYLPHQHRIMQHSSLYPGANAGIGCMSVPYGQGLKADIPWPGGVSLSEQSHPIPSASAEMAGSQTPTSYSDFKSQTVESQARSVSQQTDGQPVDEDLDLPAHNRHSSSTLHTPHSQHVPTHTAQSHVTPSQGTNTPIRTDHSQRHVHTSLTCPSHLSTVPQPFMPAVYQTPQGPIVQLSAGGECASPYPTPLHPHAMHFHTQPPSILDTFSTRALPAPSPMQPFPYVSVSQGLPASGQQKHAARTRQQQQQQQQQQQPVVQHPSDSSVSQNSSEPNASQDIRQFEGGHPTAGSQETTAPEDPPQEKALLPQQPYSRSGLSAPGYLPRSVGHHYTSGLRAAADYHHVDYQWQRAQSMHSYQPTPLCVLGYPSQPSRHYYPQHSAWPDPTAMFLTPPSPNLLVSSAGMMVTSSPQQGQSTASHWQAPYLYPHTHMTRHAGFNPNFNLSNSNPHIFLQEVGENTVQVLPLSQESGRITVIGSDHSINSNTTTNAMATTKTGFTGVSRSDLSLQTVSTDAPEVTRNNLQPVLGATSAYSVPDLQSGDSLMIELAASEEKSQPTPLPSVQPQDNDQFQDSGTTTITEQCQVFQTDTYVREHIEVPPSPSGSITTSGSNGGMETQL